jgi:hypothetical protein
MQAYVVLVEPLRLGDAVRVTERDVGQPAAVLASPGFEKAAEPLVSVLDLDNLERDSTVGVRIGSSWANRSRGSL